MRGKVTPVLIPLLGLALLLAAALAYRWQVIEPRSWVAACAPSPRLNIRPWACEPRFWVLHAQAVGLWGGAALGTGLAAFVCGRRALPLLAMALGLLAVVNQNASWGMLGLMLGAWRWLEHGMSRS